MSHEVSPKVAYETAMRRGDFAGAVAALRRSELSLEEGPRLEPPLSTEAIEDVRAESVTADAVFQLGFALWPLSEYALLAVDIFIDAAERGCVDAFTMVGDALSWLGMKEKAIPWLERALVDGTSWRGIPWVSGLLGDALLEVHGVEDRSLALLRVGAATHDEFVVEYASALVALDETDEARAVLEPAMSRDVYGAAILLGNILDREGDIVGAEEAYRRGIATGDGFSAYNLGVLLLEDDRDAEAAEAFALARAMGDLTEPPET